MLLEQNLTAELLGIFKITRGKDSQKCFDERVYDCFGIRLSGEAEFKSGDKSYTVSASDMIYIPSNAHYSQKTDGETIIAIHFINYSAARKREIEVFTFNDPEKYHEIILEMYRAWNEKKSGYKHYCTSLFYRFIYLASEQKTDNRIFASENLNIAIDNAVNFIHKNYKSKQISVSELASMMSVSETYFRRLFKNIYHMSPSQYIINLRLEYASQLLLSRFYTVKEVAEKSGFTDAKYFSRIFKDKFGKTPRSYADNFSVSEW